jgi:hypothetical protein
MEDMIEKLSKELPPPNKSLNDLIGREFKRDVYGLSIWTDTIKEIVYKYKLIDRTKKKLELYVIGNNTPHWYSIDEIVLVNQKLYWIEEAQFQKREFHEQIRTNTLSEENKKRLVFPLNIEKNESKD